MRVSGTESPVEIPSGEVAIVDVEGEKVAMY